MIALLLFLASSTTPAHAPAAAHPKAAASAAWHSKDAPLDEYFGPQKMSAIAIRMRIDALGRSYHQRTIADGDLLHDAQLVEQSLHAWAERYPADKWIAPTTYHLAQLYMEVQTPDARTLAKNAFAYVTTAAPGTREAHAAKARLSAGFPPLRDETAVVTTPSPAPLQTTAPAGATSAAPAPSAAAASPSPAASAPAAATTVPAPSPEATLHGVLTRPH